MAWTIPPTLLPQDRITAAYFNKYVRDNQLETLAGTTPIDHAIATVNGPNDVEWRAIRDAQKTTTSSTSSTSPVAVGPTLSSVVSSGHWLMTVQAEISNTGSGMASYCIGTTGGTYVSIARAVRSNSNDRLTLTSHVIMWETPKTLDFTGWLWTSDGGTTASVYNAKVQVICM